MRWLFGTSLASGCAALVSFVASICPASADPVALSKPDLIGFCSRQGMEVTVTEKHGINTADAKIVAHLTFENARTYCVAYKLDQSDRCVTDYLNQTILDKSITANCDDGTFTNFYGEALRFYGKNPIQGAANDYIVANQQNGRILEAISASGLAEDLAGC